VKIVFYCQYVWGMGHLFRSIALARALAGHDVTLVAGGQNVDVDLPGHVELVRLPVLYMDETFTSLIAGTPGKPVASMQQERRERLTALFDRLRPDICIVELYPFGRTAFGFELEPLLEAIRRGDFGRTRTVCSIRDVLVEKRDPQAYEARVVDRLNRWFDLLLVHSDERVLTLDETFSRCNDIRIPVRYTGFVAPRPDPTQARALRERIGGHAGEKLIVASCGGGRAGYRLLGPVLAACRQIRRRISVQLEVFTGPFMEASEFEELQSMAGNGLRVQRFTPIFLDYLSAADLSISLAGYNTCMNLLATGVPALVLPYARQREQPLRVEKLKPFLTLRVLEESDLEPDRLCRAIEGGLAMQRQATPPPLNLDGAATTARIVENWSYLL
jgi:predicted glycosyltransferase